MVISGTTPTSSTDSSNAVSSQANATSTTSSTDPNDLASEDTFLKLFVAQLQNQDPLNPNEQDPTQMVSELAQFSELEQLVNIGQNVQSIDQVIAPTSTSPSSSQTASGTDGVSGSTNSSQGT
ncbi:MAG TPA: flagellar hook capping FlgD N-terminal domain-containing protein [Bryobacteraceae bacterium]|nr:flagellar hook capping FlgD N-terminal domain-containing protein [Bryobacteraceae bacterium]